MAEFTNPNSQLTKEELLLRLEEAEDTLRAIRSGEVDALVVSGTQGEQIYTLKDATLPYQVLIEEMNEGALTINPQGMILYCNARFAEILGLPMQAILGESFIRFVIPGDRARVMRLLEQRPEGKNRGELTLSGDQVEVPVGISLKEMILDNETRLGVVISDLTERKQADAELRRYQEHLEEMVSERTRELEAANEALRASRRAAINLIEDAESARQQAEQTSAELARISERLRVTLTSIGDGVIAADADGRVTFLNPVAETLTGWEAEEALGHPAKQVFQIINEQTRQPAEDIVTRVLDEKRVVALANHTALLALDGREIPIEDSAAPILDAEGNVTGVVLVFHDVTEKRRAQETLRRLNRTLKALSDSNQAMMRAVSETDYLNDVCRIIMEDCGHKLVWIGYAEDGETKSVRPVASAGFEAGYLETLKLTWADDERGRGPTGTAIRTGKTSRCRNMLTDPQFEPWRAEALKRGYASSIVLPLMGDNRAFGAISIYSVEPDPFSDEEEQLLTELAGDLAYGIATIRLQEARDRAEEALRQSEERLALAQQSAGAGLWDWNMITDELEWSPEMFQLFGLDPAKSKATFETWRHVMHPEDRMAAEEQLNSAIQKHVRLENEYRITLPSGEGRWISALGDTVYGVDDKPQRMSGICLDITERKRVEAALRASEERYRTLFDCMSEGFALHEIICDEAGNPSDYRFLDINASFERLAGLRREAVVGRLVSEVMPGIEPYWIETYGRVALTGEPIHYENYAALLKRHFEVFAYSPAPRQFAVLFMDITHRKQAEEKQRQLAEALAQRVTELQTVMDVAPVGIAIGHDIEGKVITVNRLLTEWLSAPESANVSLSTPEEERTVTYEVLRDGRPVPAEDLPIQKAAITAQEVHNDEFSLVRSDGRIIEMLANAKPLFDSQGQVRGSIAAYYDITERKQAETRLAYLASYPEHNPNPVMEIDFAGQVRYTNPAALRLIPGLQEQGLTHPWLAGLEPMIVAFREGQTDSAFRDVAVGEQIFQQALYPLTQENLIRIYGVDITRRIQAEAALRESEAQLKQAQEIANLGSWELDLVNDRLSWSDEVYRIFGLQPQEFGATFEAFLEAVHPDDRAAVDDTYSRSIREGRDAYEIEHRVVRRSNNEIRFVHEKCEHFRDASGRIVRSVGMVHDITARKQAENALRQARDELELRVQERTQELKIANSQLLAEVAERQKTQEQLETNMQELEVAQEELRENNDELLASQQRLEAEIAERRRAQEELLSTVQELQVIEEELRTNNDMLLDTHKVLEGERQRYLHLFEFAPDGYLVTDKNGALLEANRAAAGLLGVAQDHLIGKPLRVFIAPNDHIMLDKLITSFDSQSGVQSRELALRPRDGKDVPVSITVTRVHYRSEPVTLRWIVRDISERKRTETQLHLQITAMQAAANGIIITDRAGAIQWCNPAFVKMAGFSEAEIIGQTPRVMNSGQHPPHFYQDLWETILDGKIWQGEIINRRKDGSLYTEEQIITPLHSETGEITHFIAIKQDITGRKQAEESVRQNAARALALAEGSRQLAEASLDIQTIVDSVARTATQAIGDACIIRLVSTDGLWLDPVACYHQRPEFQQLLQDSFLAARLGVEVGYAGQVFRSGQALLIPEVDQASLRAMTPPEYLPYLEQVGLSGTILVPVRAQGQTMGTMGLVRDPGSKTYTTEDQAFLQNLADRAAQAIQNASLYNELQEALRQEQMVRDQLVQSEKFAAMGRMLASITHEINNPLQTIKNCLYLSREDIPTEAPVYEFLTMASAETDRLSNLVAQLREVYRPPVKGQNRPVFLPALLAEVQALLGRHLLEKHVRWVMPPPEAEPFAGQKVDGIPDQLKQVFLNIGLNAVDAMQPNGGDLMVDLFLSEDGGWAGIRFKDSGPGLTPEVKSRLFEPFLTTKEKGLGLGLAICYEIIQRHNGRIEAESQPGEGASFTVWLPVRREKG